VEVWCRSALAASIRGKLAAAGAASVRVRTELVEKVVDPIDEPSGQLERHLEAWAA
jgi:hypothetical protein